SHFVPNAAKRVVGEKLDNVARSEELIANGQFAAISWRGRLLAHLLSFRRVVVVLVNPADRFILGPEGFEIGRVEELEKLDQCWFAEKEKPGGGASIRCTEIDSQLVEKTKKISTILMIGVAQSVPCDPKVNLEPFRLIAAPH